MLLFRLLPVPAIVVLLAGVPSCGSRAGDEATPATTPPASGKGDRIRDIGDPDSPKKAAHKTPVSVTGAVIITIDGYDETGKGNSAGTIYVSDLASTEPYSGIALFNPTFVPGNLRIGVGDTLDFRGEYQENNDVPLKFAPGAFLVQLASPVGTFRFDAKVPEPAEIKIEELAEYAKGRKWLNMLVRVKNVTVQRNAKRSATNGRLSVALLPEAPLPGTDAGASQAPVCEVPGFKAPTMVNELFDTTEIEPKLTKDTVIKSLTGIVTFFCNLHIAPRSLSDIEL